MKSLKCLYILPGTYHKFSQREVAFGDKGRGKGGKNFGNFVSLHIINMFKHENQANMINFIDISGLKYLIMNLTI